MSHTPPPLNSFIQSYYRNWEWNTLEDWQINALPYGAAFWTIHAPIANLKQWTITRFEVRQCYDIAFKRHYRGYVDTYSAVLEQAPFAWSVFDKTRKELDMGQEAKVA